MNNNKQKKPTKITLLNVHISILLFLRIINTLISIVKYDYYDILDATFILFVNYRRGN
jgi:hypothetical protein